MKLKLDKFVIAIIATIVFAYFFPQWSTKDGFVSLDTIGSIGISFIFFFYGLKLSPEKIISGLKNWKVHVWVQASTFLLFPLIVLAFYPVAQTEQAQIIWLAFMFLAALPSTVSSSVVMVSMAKGNVPVAIFNASISGLIGIVITPLWMGFFLEQSAEDFHLGAIYIKLITEILLPVVLGLILQRYWGKYAQKYSSQLSTFDKSIILIIIYKSFASSFQENVFQSVESVDLLIIFLATIFLFYTVYFITGFISKKLGFNMEDRITAQFCGTKKSLVHGTVFSKILIPASIPTGIILLPLMLFHAAQIFIISIIAAKLAKRDLI
jgi:solute carrier family 10 (sodium/bile acid cotransporter), member 7